METTISIDDDDDDGKNKDIGKENNSLGITESIPTKTTTTTTKKVNVAYQLPFVEKYRPKTLEDVVGNEETVQRLRAISKTGNLPNLILSGPPGTGKTTSIHALARELLGHYYKDAVLELNASDARGIDVVRNRIKSFAMNKVILPPGRHKIIILDEADSMTGAAQQALRRTMEIFSNTTRFCLACNVSTKIIEAIQSRAAILRYSKLTHDQVLECLLRVCHAEKINYTDDGLEAILFTSEGDMRHALNTLQACFHVTAEGDGGIITHSAVFKVCDQPHPQIVAEIIDLTWIPREEEEEENKEPNPMGKALRKMQSLCQSGYATSDIIGTLFKVVKAHLKLPEALKLEFLREIGFTHLRISDGVNSPLQLYGLVARLYQIAQKQ